MASVKRELKLFADLLPMIFQDLRAEWSEDIIATDASEWGLGAVISRGDPAAIAASGRLCERWRFRAAEGLGGARQQAGMEVGPVGSIIEPDADGLTPAGRDWHEVPAELLKGPWKLVGRSKWQRQEHINVLEGRALCYGINRLARRSSNLGKRVLMLCDSMVVTLATSKGRSSAGSLVQVMRRIAALLLATGISLHVRWLPSERNPSDAASRGEQGPGYLSSAGVVNVHDGKVIAGARGPACVAQVGAAAAARVEERGDAEAEVALRLQADTPLASDALFESRAVVCLPAGVLDDAVSCADSASTSGTDPDMPELVPYEWSYPEEAEVG